MIFTFSKALILHELDYQICDKDGLILSLYTMNGVHFYYNCGGDEYSLYCYQDKYYLTPESQAKYEKAMEEFYYLILAHEEISLMGESIKDMKEARLKVYKAAQELPPVAEEEIL